MANDIKEKQPENRPAAVKVSGQKTVIAPLPTDHDPRPVLVALRDVSKIYANVNALKDINLDVHKGEWLSIMGSSGSGKTTMMNIKIGRAHV